VCAGTGDDNGWFDLAKWFVSEYGNQIKTAREKFGLFAKPTDLLKVQELTRHNFAKVAEVRLW